VTRLEEGCAEPDVGALDGVLFGLQPEDERAMTATEATASSRMMPFDVRPLMAQTFLLSAPDRNTHQRTLASLEALGS
jgi:hypothetical protein